MSRHVILVILFLFASLGTTIGTIETACAFDWVPSEEEIRKYRRSWNPLTNGPILISGVDISPKGQYHAHPFLFGQYSERGYGNQLTTKTKDSGSTLYSISPLVNFGYGWSDHIETELSLKALAYTQNGPGDKEATVFGPADTSFFIKYRPIVQDPDGWRPSVTTFNQIILPTEKWFGTKTPAGGFTPIGRLPSTKFGSLTWTEGLEMRKNLRPFRISGGVFYSYHFPGHEDGINTYPGDIMNTRLIIEHILDDAKGFGYNLEFVGLHVLPWRADGHPVNVHPTGGLNTQFQTSSSHTIGVEPAIQFKFTENIVGAAGVLIPIAGQNSLSGIFPNFSIYFYGSKSGKVIMR
jgi:hypothetical protein